MTAIKLDPETYRKMRFKFALTFWEKKYDPFEGVYSWDKADKFLAAGGYECATDGLIAAASEMFAALKVIVHTPSIRAFLMEHDPKALEQAGAALLKAEGE